MTEPDELKAARTSLNLSLPKGASAGSSYGTLSNGTIGWFLVVYTDNATLIAPTTHAGFTVKQRGIPIPY